MLRSHIDRASWALAMELLLRDSAELEANRPHLRQHEAAPVIVETQREELAISLPQVSSLTLVSCSLCT